MYYYFFRDYSPLWLASVFFFVRVHTTSLKIQDKNPLQPYEHWTLSLHLDPESVIIWKQSVKKGSRQKRWEENDWIFHRCRILRESVRSPRCWFAFQFQQMKAGQTGQKGCMSKQIIQQILIMQIHHERRYSLTLHPEAYELSAAFLSSSLKKKKVFLFSSLCDIFLFHWNPQVPWRN